MSNSCSWKNSNEWKPSKFVLDDGAVVPSPCTPGASYLVAALVGEFYQRAVPVWVSGTLADVGCGAAPLYELYAPHARAAVWLDWPASLHANAGLDAACDLNVGLPVRDRVFDVVIVSDVLEHIRRPSVAWSELLRTLRPGGVVLGNAPFMYWIHEAPYDYHRYTEYAIRADVEDAGGEVLSIEAIGGSLDVLVDFLGKHLARVPFVGERVARAMGRVALRFGRTRAGRRLRVGSAAKFPLGYAWVVRRPWPAEQPHEELAPRCHTPVEQPQR